MASYDRLLDRITYTHKAVSRETTDLCGVKITVNDVFPFNPDSKTAGETAERWASGYGYWRNKKDGEEEKPLKSETMMNNEFVVKIIDLSVRSEGGRAYKVVDLEGRCFDLREDQLLEAIEFFGILAGGTINCKFVWGVSGSQVKMVVVGGLLHGKMRDFANQVKTEKVISLKDLVPGKVYKKRDGSLMGFIGKVKLPDVEGLHCAFHEFKGFPSWKPDPDAKLAFENRTWDERLKCDADYHYFGKDMPPVNPSRDITIVKSPKLYSVEEGTFDFTDLKENVNNLHTYTGSGYGWLSEVWYAKNRGGRPPFDTYQGGQNYWSYSSHRETWQQREERQKEYQKKLAAAQAVTRLEWKNMLVWK